MAYKKERQEFTIFELLFLSLKIDVQYKYYAKDEDCIDLYFTPFIKFTKAIEFDGQKIEIPTNTYFETQINLCYIVDILKVMHILSTIEDTVWITPTLLNKLEQLLSKKRIDAHAIQKLMPHLTKDDIKEVLAQKADNLTIDPRTFKFGKLTELLIIDTGKKPTKETDLIEIEKEKRHRHAIRVNAFCIEQGFELIV
jgi:hypothetical protein